MTLATFAIDPLYTKGRLHLERLTPYRNEFQRDRDRIIHSNAFRRLQYKTQVFINHEGDHYRNRLTHSIEVSSVARSVASALGVSEDLAECIALAHDLGHTPFGHAGEDALNECMRDYSGFCHNAHAIKLLTFLEKRYGAYDGLNLTWEVLEGIAKHNGPLVSDVPEAISFYNAIHDLQLNQFSSAESQVAAMSDDIAYHCHDIEDSIRANMFDLEELETVGLMAGYIHQVRSQFPKSSKNVIIYEVIRHLMHFLINDLLTQSRKNITAYGIVSSDDIRLLDKPIICFSRDGTQYMSEMKNFLFKRVYHNHKVLAVAFKCKQVIKKLFELYNDDYGYMPLEWRNVIENDKSKKQRVIADYIAGMTDRYAIKEFQLFYNMTFGDF